MCSKLLGLYPGITDAVVPLGIECAGRITAVGPGVGHFQPGDEVIALAPYCFGRYAITPAYGVVKQPAGISADEAATIPVTFVTSFYALHHLGQIRRGQRVLIHAAAGGVGQAAIQIAQAAGAEVFATAGTPQKREFLRSLGVEHVFDSRTLDFADEIRRITDQQGIDLVLNSLSGEAIPKSLGLLRAYGRFLEIGKIDIYQNRMLGLLPFQNNLSYFAIDMDRLFRERPDLISQLFAELMPYFASGQYRPLPYTRFALTDITDAFRYMAQRKNVGKVLVSLSGSSQPADGSAEMPGTAIQPEATYLITGGMGALGLELAEWLAAQGATHLALLGRRAASESAERVIQRLRQAGTTVEVIRADVASAKQLDAALEQIKVQLPPLRGVIHAAGVLNDGLIVQLDADQFNRVMAPKVHGAWNLHRATHDAPLDFFVLFSSVASVVGSQGQANYAAANSFLDALAQERRQLRLPALSLNFGPFQGAAGVGSQARRKDAMGRRGLTPLPVQPTLTLLEKLLRVPCAQLTVLAIDWNVALRLDGSTPPQLVSQLVTDNSATSAQDDLMLQELRATQPDQRHSLLIRYFVETLARVTGQNPSRIDADEPLKNLGLDSLMIIELKNVIELNLQISIPLALLFQDPSLTQLAERSLELASVHGLNGLAKPEGEESLVTLAG